MNNAITTGIESQRIEWLDALRAFAILLVLIGHKTNNLYLEQVIYSFHVPLFFWISGFVYDQSKYRNFSNILVKKSKSLLLPYFVFALFSFIFWLIVVRSLSMRGQALSVNPLAPFWGILYGVGIDPWRNPIDTALWFLPCLFVTDILFWCINNYSSGFIRVVTLLLFGILGYCTSMFTPFRLPWSVDVAFIAVIFYYLGNITKCRDEQVAGISLPWKILIMCSLSFIVILLSNINGKADMNHNYYGNIFFFVVAALSGIYLFYMLIRMLPFSKITSYIAKNTIVIVGLGGIAAFILNGLRYLLFHTLPSQAKLDLPMTIFYSLLEICLMIPAIYIINRFIPFIVGRKKIDEAVIKHH